jgi:hypothetical protein
VTYRIAIEQNEPYVSRPRDLAGRDVLLAHSPSLTCLPCILRRHLLYGFAPTSDLKRGSSWRLRNHQPESSARLLRRSGLAVR